MIKLIFILGVSILSCGPAKTGQTSEKTDSAKVPVLTDQPAKDSVLIQTPKDTTPVTTKELKALPTCIKNKIDSFKVAQKHQQPQKIVEYLYKGKKVYYVVMPCCDFFNEVYDDKCKLLGSPDGGFTGKGDGKLPDFFKEVSKEKILWEADK